MIEDNDSDFADVTLACEDGHQLEAHKVILDGSRPPNNHPHPLVLAKGFHLSSKIFLLRWKTKVRGRHLRPNFDEKQGTKSRISKGENYLLNIGNQEEREKLFYKILKIKRKRIQFKNLVNLK